ncbi:hypothetical protein Pth03_40940 [Planotetraspora thailandica]|uniref:CBM2 domain-containing protein n=1 Tax=Planotetraspora thailandica TaxID=487172 RepID=A0A8J3V406_9ACTN|nr:hypothetical protein [Planotetraspora thailandica]GII55705.1 hypothetical protein Pth03_40940 [Planotetraspora thailandica]
MGRHSGVPPAGARLPDDPSGRRPAPGRGESHDVLVWRGEPEPEPEPPKKGAKTALVAAASLVVAVGLVAGGIRLLSGGRTGDVVVEPLRANCAASCPSTRQDEPVSIDGFVPTGDPVLDPTTSSSPSATPSPSATATAGRTPTPAVTRTRAGGSTTGGGHTGPSTTPNSPSSGGGVAPPSGGGPSAPPTAPASAPATQPSATKQVSVNVRLLSQHGGTYYMQVDVRNDAVDLQSWTITLPVEGRVRSVNPRGRDNGDGTVTISSTNRLPRGSQTMGAIVTVRGSYRAPSGCALSDGTCTVK